MSKKFTSMRLASILGLSLVLAGCVAALAACGKKGDPKPPDRNSDFPKQYPR